ncbi:MAG: hypothetical protein HYR56_18620 [Acidobacteria bacterium]|nr:hypothetical protein [Acidobacteriota bacterium]MBI3424745.1 hypothetical protein [Acidobacteriota bacterium]
MALPNQAMFVGFDAPTIGNYLWAYNETVRKFRARRAFTPEFNIALVQLIETHLRQIELLAGLKTHNGANEVEQPTPPLEADVAPYFTAVQRLTPHQREDPWRGPLQTLVRTHLYQLGIFGGWQYELPAVAAGVAAPADGGEGEAEGEDGLKRCPDGSLVQHGVGCP